MESLKVSGPVVARRRTIGQRIFRACLRPDAVADATRPTRLPCPAQIRPPPNTVAAVTPPAAHKRSPATSDARLRGHDRHKHACYDPAPAPVTRSRPIPPRRRMRCRHDSRAPAARRPPNAADPTVPVAPNPPPGQTVDAPRPIPPLLLPRPRPSRRNRTCHPHRRP